MKAIIVGQDADLIGALAARLDKAGLKVLIAENASEALTIMKQLSVQFVVADSSLLIEQNLARELLKRSPLIRLVGFSVRTSVTGMLEALTEGLIDYFPRTAEYCDAVVELIISERRRLSRWRNVMLTDSPAIGE